MRENLVALLIAAFGGGAVAGGVATVYVVRDNSCQQIVEEMRRAEALALAAERNAREQAAKSQKAAAGKKTDLSWRF